MDWADGLEKEIQGEAAFSLKHYCLAKVPVFANVSPFVSVIVIDTVSMLVQSGRPGWLMPLLVLLIGLLVALLRRSRTA